MIKEFSQPTAIKEVIDSENLVVALFSDLGCNVCLAITPQLIELSEKFTKVAFVSADVEAIKELVGTYLVFVYPTVIIFAQGKETQRYERVFSMDDIEHTIARYDALLNG